MKAIGTALKVLVGAGALGFAIASIAFWTEDSIYRILGALTILWVIASLSTNYKD